MSFAGHAFSDFQLGMMVGALLVILASWVTVMAALSVVSANIQGGQPK